MILSPLVWSVVAAPVVPVEGTDGRIHLAYELQVSNVSITPVRIESVEAVDPSDGGKVVGADRVVAIDDGNVTGKVKGFARKTTMGGIDYSDMLGAGQSGIVFFDVTFSSRGDIPCRIAHRVTAVQPEIEGQPRYAATGGFADVGGEAVVLGPPLKGEGWVDGDGCCEILGPHRLATLPINGRLRPPEHFAIDFVQLDANGLLFTGDPKVLESWHFYGAEIVAAAPGRVTEAVDGLPDQVPGRLPPDATAASAAGNHVIVDMG